MTGKDKDIGCILVKYKRSVIGSESKFSRELENISGVIEAGDYSFSILQRDRAITYMFNRLRNAIRHVEDEFCNWELE